MARHPPPGLREIVPAFNTLLLEFSNRPAADAAATWLTTMSLAGRNSATAVPPEDSRPVVQLPVQFDGPDLAELAQRTGLSIETFIARFVEADYRVACLGFSPGFPYLAGLPPALQTPRRSVPRTWVPAGSVGIGGSHAGIYPSPSPGGWNLLGRTPERLFCPEAATLEAMFRLWPGDRIQFRRIPAEDSGGVAAPAGPKNPSSTHGVLRVNAIGMGLAFQDEGRPGYRRFGVPAGGAMDISAAQTANLLVGNPPAATVLECCGPGQRFTAIRDGWVAVVGCGTIATELGYSQRLRAGESLTLPPGPFGRVWSYVAVPGGFSALRCLESTSTNRRAGIGRLIQVGDILMTDTANPPPWPSAVARRSVSASPRIDAPIRVWMGPQGRHFPESARESLVVDPWTITPQCDRVGYRLTGTKLSVPQTEMISEPVLPGSIQIPPDGCPIVTMPDGPTLGGYPKLGVIDPDDLPRLAQQPPGSRVRFAWYG